jgi:hypothetical protein
VSELVRELKVSCCEVLLLKEEGERPPFKAVTRQRLVKTQKTANPNMLVTVRCEVWRLAIALWLRSGSVQ